jgi:hypothetical protein
MPASRRRTAGRAPQGSSVGRFRLSKASRAAWQPRTRPLQRAAEVRPGSPSPRSTSTQPAPSSRSTSAQPAPPHDPRLPSRPLLTIHVCPASAYRRWSALPAGGPGGPGNAARGPGRRPGTTSPIGSGGQEACLTTRTVPRSRCVTRDCQRRGESPPPRAPPATRPPWR